MYEKYMYFKKQPKMQYCEKKMTNLVFFYENAKVNTRMSRHILVNTSVCQYHRASTAVFFKPAGR